MMTSRSALASGRVSNMREDRFQADMLAPQQTDARPGVLPARPEPAAVRALYEAWVRFINLETVPSHIAESRDFF